ARERGVGVAVVGGLRQHGEDQLVEPLAVGRRDRAPVDEAEAVAQRADAAARRALPLRARDGYATASRHDGARYPWRVATRRAPGAEFRTPPGWPFPLEIRWF